LEEVCDGTDDEDRKRRGGNTEGKCKDGNNVEKDCEVNRGVGDRDEE
jgi:hypothetical protein